MAITSIPSIHVSTVSLDTGLDPGYCFHFYSFQIKIDLNGNLDFNYSF